MTATARILPTLSPESAAARRWPVAVVGAGLAGIAAALELRRTGVEVLLLDKARFPRAKTCGGCLNSRSVQHLSELGCGPLLGSLGGQPLSAFELCIAGRQRPVALRGTAEALPFAISRHVLDAALIREAIARGVHFIPEASIARLDNAPEACRLMLHGHDAHIIEARAVVLAEGMAGSLARRLGLPARAPRFSLLRPKIGLSALLPATVFPDLPGRTISMFAGAAGYAGLVRVEDGQWNLAAAIASDALRAPGRTPQHCVRELLAASNVAFDAAQFSGADWLACPAFPRAVAQPAAGRVLLAGDSAGYIEPITGEGMAWALEAGRLAGRTLAAGWSPRAAAQYSSRWRRAIGRHRRLAGSFAFALQSAAGRHALMTLLAAAPQLGGIISGQLNRPIAQHP